MPPQERRQGQTYWDRLLIGPDLIPELARHGLQQQIELEVAAVLGADRHERSEERLGYRYGYRPRTLTTQVGDLNSQEAYFTITLRSAAIL